jgi:hypothetical protein
VGLASKIGLGEPVRSGDPATGLRTPRQASRDCEFRYQIVVGWSLLQEWNEPISECTPIWKDAAVKKRKLKDDRAKLGPRISFVSKNSAISASQSTNTLRA